MTTKKETIIADDTCLDNSKQEEIVNNPVTKEDPTLAKSGKSENLKMRDIAAGAVGAVAGIGGMMGISSFSFPDEPVGNPDPNPKPIPEPSHFVGAEVPVSHDVSDDMNFNEAFAAARKEVGPGGVFSWHEGVYGTYYADEWQEFSDEYQQSFSNYPYSVNAEQQAGDSSSFGDIMPPLVDLSPDEQDAEEDLFEDFPVNPTDVDETADIVETPANEGDVVIISAENIVIIGQEVTVIPAEVDGPDTAIVDAFSNDNYEITVLDDSYEATALDDNGNPEPDFANDFDNDDFNTDGIDDAFEDATPFDLNDANPATLLAKDISADFNNQADINNFV